MNIDNSKLNTILISGFGVLLSLMGAISITAFFYLNTKMDSKMDRLQDLLVENIIELKSNQQTMLYRMNKLEVKNDNKK